MADAQLTSQPEFQKAYRAHEERHRISTGKIASALVVFLMPPGVVLDYFVYRADVVPFLFLRLLGSALGAVLWYLHTTRFGRKHVRWLGLPIPLVPAFCICWMIYIIGEPASPYYAGLNLILLAISVVVRWSFIESLLAVAGVTLMYFVAAAGQSGPLNEQDLRGVVNNLYFLILTGVIAVTGNYFFSRLQFREFRLNYELEKNKQQLEDSNRKLTELDQIKGRFFANISHELRTPLTLIISPLETILGRYRNKLDADAVDLLQTMQSNGLRLLKLINDLLDLVRLDSGVMQVNREAVALDEFLRGMASAARQMAEDKRIQLVVTVAPDLCGMTNDELRMSNDGVRFTNDDLRFTNSESESENRKSKIAMVDRDKLEKIVQNLQFNALKFTPSEGRVELRLNKEFGVSSSEFRVPSSQPETQNPKLETPEWLVLKVSDTGIGIPKDKLPQMFQRFMQADTSSRRKYQGVGIGLALVKELVEVQGGEVTVESVEGQGSTFTVRLPFIAAPAGAVSGGESEQVSRWESGKVSGTPARSEEWLSNLYHRANLFSGTVGESGKGRNTGTPAPRHTGTPAPPVHAHTVLIADDQPDMLRFITSQLAPHYNIIEASDGQQAVDQAAAAIPDIILLDMMMPEKDGIQAAREIRAAPATQNVPIILITAHVDEETKLNALRAGASDFLPKPFSTTELHVRVKNLVESHDFERKVAAQNAKLADTIELLKATEMQLVQTEKIVSLGRLSAGIIHEINNPLNFAATALYTLRQQGERLAREKPAELAEVIQDISDGLQRVKGIVSDLRTFTHPDAMQMEDVHLTEVINTTLRFLSAEWKDKVVIDRAVPEDLVFRANRNKILQVFVNLFQNSLDALNKRSLSMESPKISITGRSANGYVIVTVRDNGEGIEEQNLSKIFDPFFTTREVGEGMGMGLSICYRIIQELNGRISVASERGQYCEFTIELPVADVESIAV